MQSSEHITNHILLTIKEDSWHQQLNIEQIIDGRALQLLPTQVYV